MRVTRMHLKNVLMKYFVPIFYYWPMIIFNEHEQTECLVKRKVSSYNCGVMIKKRIRKPSILKFNSKLTNKFFNVNQLPTIYQLPMYYLPLEHWNIDNIIGAVFKLTKTTYTQYTYKEEIVCSFFTNIV